MWPQRRKKKNKEDLSRWSSVVEQHMKDIEEEEKRLAEEKMLQMYKEAIKQMTSTSSSSNGRWTNATAWQTTSSPYWATTTKPKSYSSTQTQSASAGSGYVQGTLPFDDPDPYMQETTRLTQEIGELRDKLEAAWAAIEELQRELYGEG